MASSAGMFSIEGQSNGKVRGVELDLKNCRSSGRWNSTANLKRACWERKERERT